jgi:hypothetical protein
VAANMAGLIRCGRQLILAERYGGGFDRLMQRSDDRARTRQSGSKLIFHRYSSYRMPAILEHFQIERT